MAIVDNRYLSGNFAPVNDELTVADLPVTGSLPDALDGRYLRNGPNPAVPPDPARYHWFSGDGMVHGVRLRGGMAEWYRNRWVRSDAVATALGESPLPGPVHEGMDFSANTNVIGHGGRTLAIVEGGSLPYELSDELETVGRCDFDGTLPGGYTAHPKKDPKSGELHAISYFWGWGNQVRYTVTDRTGRVSRVVDIPTGGPISLHDMSITERYVVVYDLPVVFDMDAAMSGSGFPYRWDPGYHSRVGLVDRRDTARDVVWVDVEPCYVFHPMNAFDDDDRVVLDVIRHPRMFDANRLYPDEGPPTLERWSIDLTSAKLTEERIDDTSQEFPRVDERRVGLRHRFGYTAAVIGRQGALVKHDLDRGTSETRVISNVKGQSEPVFVPASPDAEEDDGWVLAINYDATRDSSDLLVINARDFTGEPQAVVHLPQRVPFGFHGNWVPAERS